MHRHKTLKNGRPTVALLVASMTSFYHEEIMKGAVEAAEEKGFNLIVYSGGPLNGPDPTAQARETVFDLVDMNLIDGVIIPISSHTRYLNNEEKRTFISRFSSVPVVNISSQIKGCLNVIADYKPGLTELMNHFINDHKYREIAFFRGPVGHIPSDERTQIYRDQLREHNIPVDESLIIYSDLTKAAAEQSVEDFFDRQGKSCDAIIGLNDNLSLGIIEALQRRNIRVPEDIAVSGTMDVPAGIFSIPPLTTIREPIYDLGKTAIYALSDKLKGKNIPSTILIPTTLIIRDSCGCSSFIENKEKEFFQRELSTINSSYDLKAMEGGDLKLLCLDILKQAKCSDDSERLLLILKEYSKGRKRLDYSSFIAAISRQLEQVAQTEKMMGWLAITSEIQLDLLRNSIDENYMESCHKTMERLIILKDRIENKLVQLEKFELNYYNSFFRYILNTLNTSFDLDAVKESAMKILNISDFYISVYSTEINRNRYAENIMAVRNNEVIEVDVKNKSFPAKQLLPANIPSYKERYSLLIFPLSFRKKPLGFLMFNFTDNNGSIFENLQVIISAALKNELQIQDLRNAEERFSDIAHSTSNWLWETNKSNNFTYSSLSVFDVLGYTEDEITGKNINDYSFFREDPYFQSMLDQEILSEKECWLRHKNDNLRCLLISAKPIYKAGVFKGYRGVFKDITDQRLQDEKINHLAYYDILTDLPNRAMFQEELNQIISSSKLKDSKFALIFLDIDRFKYVNDSMGHASGDLMLIHVGKVLQQSIRSHDILARLGGDEFTIILPKIDNDSQIISITERIMKNLETPLLLKDKYFQVTMSLGIAMYPHDGNDSASLLKKADNAMYQAKLRGRNRFVFNDSNIEEKNALRKLNEDNLRDAMDNNYFIIHYQPQVDAISGALQGVEALVRINKEETGIISPNNFIPLAEELGLIGRIDEWVFNEACRQYDEWRNKGYEAIRISINISALQLRNKDLVERYLAIMESFKINPMDIQLEITENSLIENEDMAMEILQKFQESGISIALDDFGTGYSSLQLINLYPIDTVKIDRSFVKDAVTNKKNEAIIKAIIHLANSLDLKIIAEGVETLEQYEFIKSLGCDEIQGYYFYKPCTVEIIESILKKN
jgi:diguanylate cyclase (GGDEF)-like protein/PAS domain S-box-containing protein